MSTKIPPSTHGRVVQLGVAVAGHQRSDGGIECRRVAQTGVAVSGGEGARHRSAGARAGQGLAVQQRGRCDRVGGVLVRNQPARVVAARAGEMGVEVHPAGHHDHPAGVQLRRVGRETLDDAPVLDADVADLAVDAVRGVVDRSAGDPEPHRIRRPRTSRSSASRVSAAPRRPGNGGSERQRHVVHPVAGAGFVNAGDAGVDGDAKIESRFARPRTHDHGGNSGERRPRRLRQTRGRSSDEDGVEATADHGPDRACQARNGAPRRRGPRRTGSRSAR